MSPRGQSADCATDDEAGAMRAVVDLLVYLAVVAGIGLAIGFVASAIGSAWTRASERARIEREAAEASWRIHQRATQAFGQMLEAARQQQAAEGREEER